MKNKFLAGCHVSIAGGVFKAPKNAADLGCETFQIFTRPPMGGKAPELTEEIIEQFKEEMGRYGYSYRYGLNGNPFVVHCPYFVNFGSKEPRIYHGSISVVGGELMRANMLGAKYVMTHLGSGKDLGEEAALKQAKEGLTEVLKKYKGDTQFLLEIAAGAGATLGGTFEQLAELMKPLVKFKTFGGVCFDTQHAWASGYDITKNNWVKEFDKAIGLKWLKMSHINDSKTELGSRKDRHEHIAEGLIGEKGFMTLIENLKLKIENSASFPLILETEHDKVEEDIKILKKLRNKLK